MNIISRFKDFYDFNTVYDTDDSLEYRRDPRYMTIMNDNAVVEELESNLTPENGFSKRTKNILVRYAKWSLTYNKVMMKSDTRYINFEYHVVGIYPYICLLYTSDAADELVPEILIYDKK